MTRVIIAGSRRLAPTPNDIEDAIAALGIEPEAVVCGCARGADHFAGHVWAPSRGLSTVHYPADWRAHGRAAGPTRNAEMAANADALIAFPCRDSRGTWDMVKKARAAGLPVHIVPL